MADEQINESMDDIPDNTPDYIETIKKLKAESVSRADYIKLKDENKKLIDALSNGEYINQPTVTKPQVDKDALRKELYTIDSNLDDVQYVTKTLELRQAIIDDGGKDPFLGITEDEPTEQDKLDAQRVADCLQSCVDYADGDNAVFLNELARVTTETRLPRSK